MVDGSEKCNLSTSQQSAGSAVQSAGVSELLLTDPFCLGRHPTDTLSFE